MKGQADRLACIAPGSNMGVAFTPLVLLFILFSEVRQGKMNLPAMNDNSGFVPFGCRRCSMRFLPLAWATLASTAAAE